MPNEGFVRDDSLLAIVVLRNLARAQEAPGTPQEAMKTYTEALQRADRLPGALALREDLLIRVGNAMLRLARQDDARRFFRAGVASAGARGSLLVQAYGLLQLSRCERQRDSAAALARAAVALLEPGAPRGAAAYSLGTLGLATLAAGNPAEALSLFRKAAEAAEESLRPADELDLFADCEEAALGRSPSPWHDEAVDLLLRLNRREEAFDVALQRSGWLLSRDLRMLTPTTDDDTLNTLLERYRLSLARRSGAEEQLGRALSVPGGREEKLRAIAASLEPSVREGRVLQEAVVARRPGLGPFVGSSTPGGRAGRRGQTRCAT